MVMLLIREWRYKFFIALQKFSFIIYFNKEWLLRIYIFYMSLNLKIAVSAYTILGDSK